MRKAISWAKGLEGLDLVSPLKVGIDSNTFFGAYPKRRVDASPTRLLEELRAHRVERAVVASLKAAFYDHHAGNLEMLRVVAEHPELLPAGVIDPRRYLGWREEVERLIEAGVRVFRFLPEHQGWPIDYAPFHQVLEELSGRRVVAMVSLSQPGEATVLARIIGDLDLPVILSGLGDAYIFFAELLVVGYRHDRVYVETHAFSTPDAYELFTRELGAERLVYGSGAPLYYMQVALRPLLEAAIEEADRAKILGGNMEALLR